MIGTIILFYIVFGIIFAIIANYNNKEKEKNNILSVIIAGICWPAFCKNTLNTFMIIQHNKTVIAASAIIAKEMNGNSFNTNTITNILNQSASLNKSYSSINSSSIHGAVSEEMIDNQNQIIDVEQSEEIYSPKIESIEE